MIKNSTLERNKWYIHPGMHDTAIEVIGIDVSGEDPQTIVVWWNICGHKRKFVLDIATHKTSAFKTSPYWQEQGEWIKNLPVGPLK